MPAAVRIPARVTSGKKASGTLSMTPLHFEMQMEFLATGQQGGDGGGEVVRNTAGQCTCYTTWYDLGAQ